MTAHLLRGLSWFLLAAAMSTADQAPQFRSGVDLVLVDVQVIDRAGEPVPGFTAADFRVTIGGRGRKVVSAEWITSRAVEALAPGAPDGSAAPSQPPPPN